MNKATKKKTGMSETMQTVVRVAKEMGMYDRLVDARQRDSKRPIMNRHYFPETPAPYATWEEAIASYIEACEKACLKCDGSRNRVGYCIRCGWAFPGAVPHSVLEADIEADIEAWIAKSFPGEEKAVTAKGSVEPKTKKSAEERSTIAKKAAVTRKKNKAATIKEHMDRLPQIQNDAEAAAISAEIEKLTIEIKRTKKIAKQRHWIDPSFLRDANAMVDRANGLTKIYNDYQLQKRGFH